MDRYNLILKGVVIRGRMREGNDIEFNIFVCYFFIEFYKNLCLVIVLENIEFI